MVKTRRSSRLTRMNYKMLHEFGDAASQVPTDNEYWNEERVKQRANNKEMRLVIRQMNRKIASRKG